MLNEAVIDLHNVESIGNIFSSIMSFFQRIPASYSLFVTNSLDKKVAYQQAAYELFNDIEKTIPNNDIHIQLDLLTKINDAKEKFERYFSILLSDEENTEAKKLY